MILIGIICVQVSNLSIVNMSEIISKARTKPLPEYSPSEILIFHKLFCIDG